MIRGESTKIVKDEIIEFLRLEFGQIQVTCSSKGHLATSLSFQLQVSQFSPVKIRERQKCEELNRRNHQNYSRYVFSTAEIILNWNVESDEVLCASFGFTSKNLHALCHDLQTESS